MNLRTRLTAAFVAVALPGAALAAATATVVDRALAAEQSRRQEEIRDEIERWIVSERRELEDELRRLVARLAEIASSAEPMGAGQRWSASTLGEAAAAARLDVLAWVDGGRLVASVHLPAAVGDPAPFSLPAPERSGVRQELVAGNPPHPVAAVLAWAPGPGSAFVYGGRRLDRSRLERLGRLAGASLRVGPAKGPGLPLPGLDGPALRLGVTVDPSELETARRWLFSLGAAVAVAGVAAALAVGATLARRLSGPVLALADAAERVRRGDLEVRVPAGPSGEIGALVAGFNQMTAELAEARVRAARAERAAAWRDVARRLAHEIKNPLSPMRLGMQNLQKAWARQHPALGEILDESTRSVLEEVAALDRLVTEFSAFARLPSPVPRPTPPAALVSAAVRLYQNRLEASVEPGLPEVLADPALVQRVLVNLVKNAEEAGAGSIRLTARASGDGVSLVVEDDGPGMDPEQLASARRGDFSTKAGGSGLGLNIATRVAEEHGGRLDIDSTAGEGTRVALWLPAVP